MKEFLLPFYGRAFHADVILRQNQIDGPQPEAQDPSRLPVPRHGILTRQPLKPAIRGRKVRLQFSAGKYLLLQNESGLFLFSMQPLRPVLHIDADYLYPVRFSSHSQTLSGVFIPFEEGLILWPKSFISSHSTMTAGLPKVTAPVPLPSVPRIAYFLTSGLSSSRVDMYTSAGQFTRSCWPKP